MTSTAHLTSGFPSVRKYDRDAAEAGAFLPHQGRDTPLSLFGEHAQCAAPLRQP